MNAGVYVLGWITYLLFASGKQQPWNTPFKDLLVPIRIPRKPRKPVMADILARSNPGHQYAETSRPGVEYVNEKNWRSH